MEEKHCKKRIEIKKEERHEEPGRRIEYNKSLFKGAVLKTFLSPLTIQEEKQYLKRKIFVPAHKPVIRMKSRGAKMGRNGDFCDALRYGQEWRLL